MNPVLTSNWDPKRGQMTYKLSIEGTTRFLLFTEDSLRSAQSQITEALKGINRARAT